MRSHAPYVSQKASRLLTINWRILNGESLSVPMEKRAHRSWCVLALHHRKGFSIFNKILALLPWRRSLKSTVMRWSCVDTKYSRLVRQSTRALPEVVGSGSPELAFTSRPRGHPWTTTSARHHTGTGQSTLNPRPSIDSQSLTDCA